MERAAAPGRPRASATCCRPPADDDRLAPAYADRRRPAPTRRSPGSWASAGPGCCPPRAGTRRPSAGTTATRGPAAPIAKAAPAHVRHLRVPRAAGRLAAAALRRVRQRVRARRRPGRLARPRLRRALRGGRRRRHRRSAPPSSTSRLRPHRAVDRGRPGPATSGPRHGHGPARSATPTPPSRSATPDPHRPPIRRDPFGTGGRSGGGSWRPGPASPARFREDANAEEDLALGGYRDRVRRRAGPERRRRGGPGRRARRGCGWRSRRRR